jgi:hypothetical protein
MLFPISSGFSQKSDNLSTLSVALTSDSPFVYKDKEGYTIVVGNVENRSENTPVTNVQLRAIFYDETGNEPLETVQGGTILEVITESGMSPYVIKSNSPNPNITHVSIVLEGFSPSSPKSQQLVVESTGIFLDENLAVSGVLTNGGSPITDTFVYLAFYDAFIPPRLIGISSTQIGDVEANEKVDFYFNEEVDQRVISFQIFAQSNIFYSNFVDEKIPEQITKLVTISGVSLNDLKGTNSLKLQLGLL